MLNARLRFLLILAGLMVILLVATGLYMLGMAMIEQRPLGFWQALEFAAETITTTGYGRDAGWDSPLMVVFVVALQFLGVMLVYMIVPLFLIPALEERFEARLPRAVRKLRGHVVIYRHGATVETLIEELDRAEVPCVIAETDDTVARRLFNRRRQVAFNSAADELLERVCLGAARALIVNGDDEENATAILIARQLGFDGELLAVVEDPFYRQPILLAGASAAFTPRYLLAATLAARTSHRISPRVSGIQRLGDRVQLSELRIDPSSPLAGKTLAEAAIGERTDTSVIGLWERGQLHSLPTADTRLDAGDTLIVLGGEDGLRALGELAADSALDAGPGPLVVAGFGEVGKKVVELLQTVDEKTFVIDRVAQAGVDLVGDVRDPAILAAAELPAARAMVLALDNDSATLLATVVIRDLAPTVPIIARVNEAGNVDRIHRAGATFALSISQVCGQLLARRLLGVDAVAIEPRLKVSRVSAERLAGRHPSELGIRGRTGCSVVAVERGEEVMVRFGPAFRFQDDDAVYICGSAEATQRYRKAFER